VTISPDGRRIVFVGSNSKGTTAIFVRPIASTTAQELAGTEGASNPFWSPDSRSIAFAAGGKLKRIDAGGSSPQNLCDLTNFWGGSWNRDGIIVFSDRGLLHRVSALGGVSTPVTTLYVTT
jgi:Tol biopolymer transport system component